ncbi:hypothetical protein [Streptomyces hokutonensis]|uniref:hypothetical protein n=1 Tax=Streptomyces hokutonensis TaxID=1306990 RepID=UPI0036C3A3C6
MAASTTSETEVPVPAEFEGTTADGRADPGVDGEVDPGVVRDWDRDGDPGSEAEALLDGSDWTEAAFALA